MKEFIVYHGMVGERFLKCPGGYIKKKVKANSIEAAKHFILDYYYSIGDWPFVRFSNDTKEVKY